MMRSPIQAGFTLVELIVVVILIGILGAGAGLLIIKPMEAYDDQLRRQQLVDKGEMALRQVAVDVRRALPNSLRLSPVGTGWALEMVNTVDGARYRDQNDDAVPAAGADEILEFSAGDARFNLLGSFNTLAGFVDGRHRIVIYNTTPSTLYQDATAANNPGIVTPVAAGWTLSPSAQYPNEQQIFINAPFQFAQQSPGQRLFVIEDPTSYICNPASGRLQRHGNYGFSVLQPTAPGGTSTTVVDQLLGCSMTYSAGTSQRGGTLTMQITLGDGSGETVNLLHQVHVENVP